MCLFCIGCGGCGKEQTPEMKAFFNAPRSCLSCGIELEPDQLNCPQCGREVPPAAGVSGSVGAVSSGCTGGCGEMTGGGAQ